MHHQNILIIGAGIGGLSSAIALGRRGHRVTLIERDPDWSVYGVGIIQQGNVLRAVDQLGVLNRYAMAGFGFDAVEVFAPNGMKIARIPSPRLLPDYPANIGISRRSLQAVLAQAAKESGAQIRLGITADHLDDTGTGVSVVFSDGASGDFDLVIGADGVFSSTRSRILPQSEQPRFTGQSVWRYNLRAPAGMDALQVYNGATGAGLVPMSNGLMYLYLTTPEPENPRFRADELAEQMRARMAHCAPAIQQLAEQITDNTAVVYRPLDTVLVTGPWHHGRVVLLGDAVHATTPHLGQGAGLAIEDSLVLAEEIDRAERMDTALHAYRARRFDRCAYIVRASLAICMGQIGKGPPVDNAAATAEMFALTAQPI